MGYKENVEIHVVVVAPDHLVTKGIQNFTIRDGIY